MPAKKRHKTRYPGVYFIIGERSGTGKLENIYYIYYRKNGRQIEEKAGRQYQDDMTPAKAAQIRALRLSGDKSNQERRKKEREIKWNIQTLWNEYKSVKDIKGIRTDENRFKNYIMPSFGKKKPVEIAPLDVDRLRVSLLKKRTPQTVAHVLELLRRIINFGVEKGLCEPIKFKIKLPVVDNTITENLSSYELQNLINVLNSYPEIQAANLIKLALFTGMRRGELFRLKWTDVDLDNGFITIQGPKGGKSQKIPINSMAMDVLKNHPQTASEYLFPGRFGGQRKSIQKEANNIKRLAGLPKNFRPMHGLRHVFASMLASSGRVDMFTLQKLLTHKGPQMTQRYAHLRDETLKDASNVASDILNGIVEENQNKSEQKKKMNK